MTTPQEISDWILNPPESPDEAGDKLILMMNGIITMCALSCLLRSETPEEGMKLAEAMMADISNRMLAHIQRSIEHTYEMRRLEEQGIDVLNTPPTIQ